MPRRFATTVCLVAFFWGLFSLSLVRPAWAKGRIGKGIASAASGLVKGRSGVASNLVNRARDLGNGNLGSAINKVRDLGNGNLGNGNLGSGKVVGRVKEAVQDIRDLRELPGNFQNVAERVRDVVDVAKVVASQPLVNRALDLNEFPVLNGVLNKNADNLAGKFDLSKLPFKKAVTNPILTRPGLKLNDILKPGVVENVIGNAAANVGVPAVEAPVQRGERLVQIINTAAPALANLRRGVGPVVVGGGSVVVAAPAAAPVAAQVVAPAVEPAPTTPAAPTADVEMLSVRLVNLGDEATKQGPLFRLTFRNNATSPMSTPVTMVLVASKDAAISADSPNAAAEVSALEAGQTATVDVRLPEEVLTMGRDAAGQPAPFATLFAVIDAGSKLTESNEENNVLSQSSSDLRVAE